MLNFNKKKYVSFDNLTKFSGMIQKALSDKLKNVETNLNEKIDSRFKSLTAKEQADSEVIDAREGQVSLSENLKTYVKKEEHENLDNKISNQIEELETNIESVSNEASANTEYINTNKSAIQRVIDFVDSFRCEFDFSSEDSCYIKLPDVFGGLIIQFGAFRCNAISDFGNEQYTEKFYDKQISLPKRFPNRVFYVNSNITGLVKSGVRKLTYHEFFDTKCSPHYNDMKGKIDVSVWRRACNIDLTGYEVIVDYLVIGK